MIMAFNHATPPAGENVNDREQSPVVRVTTLKR